MNLIIPIAQSVSTASHLRPSWLWVHPNGNLLVAESVRGLNLQEIEHVYVGVLASHLQQYSCLKGLRQQLIQVGIEKKKLKIISLNKPTTSQPDTVAQIISRGKISGPIFIKDADNYFKFRIRAGNCVAVSDLNKVSTAYPASKSYVSYDDNGLVSNIVEKNVISNMFCSGGYGFDDASQFLHHFNKIKQKSNLYISHIIYSMLLAGTTFKMSPSEQFLDWGTIDQWQKFRKKFATIFIDLDGTLVENSGQHFPPFWGETAGLSRNIAAVNNLYESGKVQVIITTSRSEKYKNDTLKQLNKHNIKFHYIYFGMLHAQRIVINDFSSSNPFSSCHAISIPRNSDTLDSYLMNTEKS